MAPRTGNERADLVVVGAGAAGLMAAIWAGRTAPGRRVVVLDGMPKLGAKILISGGGRCNVTHHAVDESAFSGSTPAAIRKVLRRFDVPATVEFFRGLGVGLKREETGKLFPVTDRARTVLDALLGEATRGGAEVRHPCRVERVVLRPGSPEAGRFVVEGAWGCLAARRVVLATGGLSVPKTGSDGHGYAMARALGHTVTPRLLPALVPLTLPPGHVLTGLRGMSLPAALEVRSGTGKRLTRLTGSTLFAHFGLSGPGVLDVSRHYLHAVPDDPGVRLSASWLPESSEEEIDHALGGLGGRTVVGWLRERLPERLARILAEEAGVEGMRGSGLGREQRRKLVGLLLRYPLPVTGSRGFAVAEVTAGGVPLSELRLETMGSRVAPGLHLVGEILDVDGRIGGFNFQWAWASGYTAGVAAGTE